MELFGSTRWKIVWLIVVVSAIRSTDWVIFSVAAKRIMPEYGLSSVEVGTLFSALAFGYAMMTLPGGVIADLIGPRLLLGIALLLWSVLTGLTAVAPGIPGLALLGPFTAFLIIRVLTGAAQGPTYPACNKMISNWVAVDERGLASGLLLGSLGIGYALTPPVSAYLMVHAGWRVAFYVFAAAGILLDLWWYYYATDIPEQHSRVSAAELKRIRGDSASLLNAGREPIPWSAMFGDSRVWLLCVVGFAAGYGFVTYQAWFYLYLTDARGFAEVSAGLWGAGPFIAIIILTPPWGMLSDVMVRRVGLTLGRRLGGMTSFALSAICIAIGASAANRYIAVVLLSLGGGLIYAGQAVIFSTIIDLARTFSGILTGVIVLTALLAGVLSPVLTPLLARHFGWEVAWYAVAAVILLGAAMWMGIDAGRQIRVATGAETDSVLARSRSNA